MTRRLILSLLSAASLFAVDITGTWIFAVETSEGNGSPTFVFKQDGEKLAGTYSGVFGEAPVAGTVKGDKIEFTFKADQIGSVVYTGVIEGASKMKGQVQFGEVASGSWTATRK